MSNSDSFIVTLFSNNSLNVFHDNVQSAFTNIVNISQNLGENWEVGISELYLNDLPSTEILLVMENRKSIQNMNKGLIFVYTDIIKPRCVGDKRTRCLRILFHNGAAKMMQFKNIEYYPIENCDVRDISILITDSKGYKVPFKPSSIPIYVTLRFRRICNIL
ncbi:hypothetical protein 4 [Drosophila-associated adintovirus 2]|uniref:Uncharacterized protein n=1 Tax=Drosophila-associated adintovirus 2 TaxID=2744817 RepID=A0A7D4ZXD8_9VIRU|nr:hypothetical protein 4 [Drosophila-associated adintovirus 2]